MAAFVPIMLGTFDYHAQIVIGEVEFLGAGDVVVNDGDVWHCLVAVDQELVIVYCAISIQPESRSAQRRRLSRA